MGFRQIINANKVGKYDLVQDAGTRGIVSELNGVTFLIKGYPFVAVARFSSTAAYSTDGITWTETVMPGSTSMPFEWTSITYGDGKFVAVSFFSDIAAYSTDGATWTQTDMASFGPWRSVAYGDGKFVAVCDGYSTAAYSTDGIAWTTTFLPSARPWQSITYGTDKFVAVAAYGFYAAYSSNGINWFESSPLPGAPSASGSA